MKNISREKAKRGAAGLASTTRGRAKSFGKNGLSKRERSRRACRNGDPRKGGG